MINATNQFVGLQGQLDLNSIKNLQSGQIFNPYSEQIFQGVGFRTHNFAFKFYARSRKESEEIRRIINYIKIGSLPKFDLVNLMKSSSTMLQNLINQVRKTSKESNLAKISTVRKIIETFLKEVSTNE